MAGIGSLLGGVAEGLHRQQTRALAEQTAADEKAARERGLDLEQQKLDATNKQNLMSKANAHINTLFETMTATAKAFTEAGQPATNAEPTMRALLQEAVDLAPYAGVSPDTLIARARAIAQAPAASTATMQDYNFYASQEKAAGRTPLSFADYNTQIKKAGATTTTVNMGGELAFSKQLGELSAKDLMTRREGALDASKSLEASEQAKALLDRGAITGIGADWLLSAGKLLQRAGLSQFEKPIEATEAFAASRAQEVGRLIKMFGSGTGLSDKDREFATKAAAGEITLNEQSIRKILDINAQASRNVIRAYNADASTVDRNIVPFDLRVPEPKPPAAPAPAAPVTKTINGRPAYQLPDGRWAWGTPPGSP